MKRTSLAAILLVLTLGAGPARAEDPHRLLQCESLLHHEVGITGQPAPSSAARESLLHVNQWWLENTRSGRSVTNRVPEKAYEPHPTYLPVPQLFLNEDGVPQNSIFSRPAAAESDLHTKRSIFGN